MRVWNALTRPLARARTSRAATREVRTPILYDVELWKQSGHWDKLPRQHVLHRGRGPADGPQAHELPGAHPDLQATSARSYRDLPIRYAEQGLVHRHEPSGTLHGLLRVRHITQDDAHIFCTEEQIEDEVLALPRLRLLHLRPLRLRAAAASSPPGPRSASAPTRCGTAPRPRSPAGAASAAGSTYELNAGDGAFYGPKIDLHMTDSIGRSWQLGTVQLDYPMPERFEPRPTPAPTTPSTGR